MQNIVILINKNCVDGFAAAWVVYYYYFLLENQDITYILNFIYMDNLDLDAGIEEFREYCDKLGCYKAYAFNINFDHKSYQKIMKIFPEIMIMNHYKSGIEISKNLNEMSKNYICHSVECGCTLAWKTFFKEKMPLTLEYIKDVILKQFRLKKSKVIWEAIFRILTIGDFDKWTKFVMNENEELEEMEKIGEILCEIRNERNIKLVETGKIFELMGKKGFIINTTENLSSLGEHIGELKDENNEYLVEFSLFWNYDMSKSQYNIYIISNPNRDPEEINIIEIAKLFTDNIKIGDSIIFLTCEKLFFL